MRKREEIASWVLLVLSFAITVISLFFYQSAWFQIIAGLFLLSTVAMTVTPAVTSVTYGARHPHKESKSFQARFLFAVMVIVMLIPAFASDFVLKVLGRRGFIITDEAGLYDVELSSAGFGRRTRV